VLAHRPAIALKASCEGSPPLTKYVLCLSAEAKSKACIVKRALEVAKLILEIMPWLDALKTSEPGLPVLENIRTISQLFPLSLLKFMRKLAVPEGVKQSATNTKSPLPVALIPENVTLEALEPSVTLSISVYVILFHPV
jgi:hypothetical protein